MIKKLSILLLFVGTSTLIEAQSLELGGFGGVSYYNGDLNPGVPFNMSKPVYGFLARYSSNTRWAFRINFTTGQLASDGKFARVNVVNSNGFVTTITDLSVVAEFNFFDYFIGSDKDYASPYIFAGFSTFGANENGFSESIGFNRFSFPIGAGVKYSLTEKLGLTAEWKMHKAFDDGLDTTVSSYLYDDPNTNDWYCFTGISLTYKFNLEKRNKCNSFDNYNIKYK